MKEIALNNGVFELRKYLADDVELYGAERAPLIESPLTFHNAYVNAGAQIVLDLMAGISPGGSGAYNSANARLGVGDSNTATTAVMTDLQAASNKLRKAMDATFPSRSGQVLSYRSTFGSTDANFAWQEAAIFNHASAGEMLCRGVQSMGTKASGTIWVLTYTITLP